MQGNSDRRLEPEHETAETALSRCLVDGDAATKVRDRRRRREAFGISFIVEFVVLALLVVVPLMTSIAQPQLSHVLPPMLIVRGDGITHTQHREAVARPTHHGYIFPIPSFEPTPGRVVDIRPPDIEGASGMIDLEGSGEIPLYGLGPTTLPVEPPRIETNKTSEKSIVKVSEGVQFAQIVSRIEPRYPPLARQIRQQGTVLLHAFINVDGRITALEVVSGPPLLVQAAVDAVRQWRYRPTYLSGQAVQVETSITVIFRLEQ